MQSMTIGKRLLLSFGVLVALLIAMGLASFNSIGTLNSTFNDAVNKTAAKAQLAEQINNYGTDMLAAQRGLIMNTYAKDAGRAESARHDFRRGAEALGARIDQITPLLERDEARRITAEIKEKVGTVVANFPEIERLCAAGDADGAVKLAVERVLGEYNAIERDSSRLVEIETQRLATDRQAAVDEGSRTRSLALILLALSLAVAGVSLWVVRGITRSLNALAGELSDGAEQVASAAAQVSASSQALAQGAGEQAASLEETSSSTEEIHSMTRKNTENSQNAAHLMAEAANLVADANRRLEQMVGSMKEINTSSDKISKIIKVIDEIAFQTNILALNAAVEAARAGEAGMGFAVVADEVRNLAQRCAQAAKDTAGLIEESISRSNEGSSRLSEVAESIRSIT
ncbi:MAG: methyl-accepting chemotaxis protein, partial [Acidobacteria bacterium]|nr:methyl-accepting chemotaxis protein [Acidobacteriota bacterium]